jgi:hypothetical protein
LPKITMEQSVLVKNNPWCRCQSLECAGR